MSHKDWAGFDRFIEQKLGLDRALFADALQANREAGLPAIDISPAQGKFLNLLIKLLGARRVLEIGTLGGYSTLWMAEALPEEGKIVTLEAQARHADVAMQNFHKAGLAGRIELRLGAATDSLRALSREGAPPFDFIFIDADKQSLPLYLEQALDLSRPGTAILADNVVRKGAVIDPKDLDPDTQGVRAMFDYLSGHPRLEATALQTVGAKDWDGFALIEVK